MAISKILYMKDCGRNFPGKHLKVAIEYISVPDKTQNGKFVAGLNCQKDAAYEQIDIVNNGWHIYLKDICTYATLSKVS